MKAQLSSTAGSPSLGCPALLRVHDLRAADATQLAAALVGAEIQTSLLPFVTLDRGLADAARREGLPIVSLSW